jgi:hypothetical protein
MKNLLCLLGALQAAACASYIGLAPLAERHKQTSEQTFYVEVLGNHFADPEMLLRSYKARARDLCKGEPRNEGYNRGNRYPHGQLDDIRLDDCVQGKFCHRMTAAAPLYYGTVQCK